MQPISKERLDWINARLFILNRMSLELSTKPNRYVSKIQWSELHSHARMTILSEELNLTIEKNTLFEYLDYVDKLELPNKQAALDSNQIKI